MLCIILMEHHWVRLVQDTMVYSTVQCSVQLKGPVVYRTSDWWLRSKHWTAARITCDDQPLPDARERADIRVIMCWGDERYFVSTEQPHRVEVSDGWWREYSGVGVMLVLVVTVTWLSSHQMVSTGLHCEHWISFHPQISFLHSILRGEGLGLALSYCVQ